MSAEGVEYSSRYGDGHYHYRHVYIPSGAKFPKYRLLKESEWRALGLEMSPGWMHYTVHKPEPNILLFRREKGFDELTVKEQEDRIAQLDVTVDQINREWKETWEQDGKIEPVEEMTFLM